MLRNLELEIYLLRDFFFKYLYCILIQVNKNTQIKDKYLQIIFESIITFASVKNVAAS